MLVIQSNNVGFIDRFPGNDLLFSDWLIYISHYFTCIGCGFPSPLANSPWESFFVQARPKLFLIVQFDVLICMNGAKHCIVRYLFFKCCQIVFILISQLSTIIYLNKNRTSAAWFKNYYKKTCILKSIRLLSLSFLIHFTNIVVIHSFHCSEYFLIKYILRTY